ncbi:MAG: GC-type dockerin domain-anchored protein, partial [Planctomycetota bacterium]
AFASGLGTANGSGVTLLGSDPLALAADGLARPVGGSPGTTGSTFTLATDDMDGDPRTQPNDIGADHVSANAPIRGPLTSEDVGPSWFSTGGDPNTSIAAFVEAEGADAILDPDGDSNVFFVQSVPGASNDEVLKSPSGSTSSPGNSETMAVYQVTFPNTGNYTAYYLARGFNGSTNSFFTPTDFATDPTQNETTSSDSNFRWETGDQFTVNSTGAPLEFRIGRRERDTEIDIIVFHPTDNLTDQELDDLVAEWQAGVCDADIDENGVLDFFDMLGYLDLYDAGDLEADTSGDGGLSPTDVIRYILSNEAGCP